MKRWLENINLAEEVDGKVKHFLPTPSSKVCAKHFADRMFEMDQKTKKLKLKHHAYPTLHLRPQKYNPEPKRAKRVSVPVEKFAISEKWLHVRGFQGKKMCFVCSSYERRFFAFPNDQILSKKWCTSLQIPFEQDYKDQFVCYKHFKGCHENQKTINSNTIPQRIPQKKKKKLAKKKTKILNECQKELEQSEDQNFSLVKEERPSTSFEAVKCVIVSCPLCCMNMSSKEELDEHFALAHKNEIKTEI